MRCELERFCEQGIKRRGSCDDRHKVPRRSRPLVLDAVVCVTLSVALLLPAIGQATVVSAARIMTAASSGTRAPLRFGIYPGGPAGSASPKAAPVPEDPARRLAALQQLRGAASFVVHLYTGSSGNAAEDAGNEAWLDSEIAAYTAAGLQVELVTRYQPTGTDVATNVSGFSDQVRRLVRRYGADPGFVALQIGNEANLDGAPAASDGAYPGALTALVRGVIAAKDEVARSGHTQVGIGFNWAYDQRASASTRFFKALASTGGVAFAAAVDWVGLDGYPGTWSPRLALTAALPDRAGVALVSSLQTLRSRLMPLAGLGAGIPLQVSENGFPTGPGRSAAMQADAMYAMVRAVDAVRGRFDITDYRWFDLRDSVSNDKNFESQFGITRDDYTPKPAFFTFRDLVASLSVPHHTPPAATPATCQASPVRIKLPRWKGHTVKATEVRAGKQRLRTISSRLHPTDVPVALKPGLARLTLRQVAVTNRGREVSRVLHRDVDVCRAALPAP